MVVDGQCVVLDVALLRDAEVVELEPSVATGTVAALTVGSGNVAIGTQTKGQGAVEDEGTDADGLQLTVGNGLYQSLEAVDLALVEHFQIVLILAGEVLRVEVTEDALCGAARTVAVGTYHQTGADGVGTVLETADGLRNLVLGHAAVPQSEGQFTVHR